MATERANDILKAATKLFAERGYKYVSIKEIASCAGVSKGLINHHFISKQHLLKCILEVVTVPLGERLDALSNSDCTVRAKLAAVLDEYIETGHLHPDEMRIILLEGYSGEETKAPLISILERSRSRFAQLVEEGIAKGEFGPIDPQVGAVMIHGTLREVLWTSVVQKPPKRFEGVADEITRLIFDGMGAKQVPAAQMERR